MSPEERKSNDAFEALIVRYLEAEKSGQNLDRDGLIEQNLELASSLREFFANYDWMKAAIREEPTLPRGDGGPGDSAISPTVGLSHFIKPSVGDRIRYFGDYELLEEIARGGMGVVFRARQVKLNRIVALKMILTGQFAGEEDVRRFYTEAEAAAQLDHPGIVPIFEIGEHQGQHFFSMGYIEGKSLANKVADGPLPPREAAEIVKKICNAMAYAHERGVIHRDLKPANILIDESGQPKVTDFGLAKKLEDKSNLTGTGQILGTPAYMPPEQAAGKTNEVGPLADTYSIGAVLYCLLTGRPPFQAATPMDTLLQVLDQEPISPKQLNSAVPVDLETICLKCLSKEPKRRYESVRALGQELDRFMSGRPIDARPVGKIERGWRWCCRNPTIASASGLAILFLIVGSIASTLFAIEANTRAAAEKRARIRESEALSSAMAARQLAQENARKASEETIRAEQELYYSRFANARLELLSARPQNALNILGQMQTLGSVELGWEWHYLRRVCQPERFTVGGQRAVFVSGGAELATDVSALPGIQLFDSITGKPTARLESGLGKLVGLDADADGQWLAATDGKRIEIWNTGERLLRHVIDVAYETWVDFDFDPSGQRLVVLSGLSGQSLTVPAARGSAPRKNVAAVYSLDSGEKIFQIDDLVPYETAVTFSPDGKELVTFDQVNPQRSITERFAVHVRDIESGQLRRSLVPFDRNLGRSTLQFSPDGATLALSVDRSLQDAEPVLLDWSTGEARDITLESLKQFGQNLRSPLFNPSGEKLAGFTENVVMIWNPNAGKLLGKIAERSSIRHIGWNPNGNSLLTVTAQGVRVWDTSKLRPELVISDSGGQFVSLSHDGKLIVTPNPPLKVRVTDLEFGRDAFVLAGNSNGTHDAAFSPDGDILATAGESWIDEAKTRIGGDVRFWTFGRNNQAKQTHQIRSGSLITKVTFSNDGQRMALRTMGQSGPAVPEPGDKHDFSERVVLVDVTNQSIIKEIACEASPTGILFSPDSKTLFVGAGNDVRLFDAGSGDPVATSIEMFADDVNNPYPVKGLGFLFEENKLVVYYGKNICVNDAVSGKILSRISVDVDGISLAGLKLHPSGNRVFVGCNDGAIRVYSPKLGKTLLELQGHEKPVNALVITPDGSKLVSTSYDNTVRVWDGTLFSTPNATAIATPDASGTLVDVTTEASNANAVLADPSDDALPSDIDPNSEPSLGDQNHALTEALQPGTENEELIAYEGFAEGGEGTELRGLQSGEGFLGAWSLGKSTPVREPTFRIARGSLLYPDLPTSGNHVMAGVTTEGTSALQVELDKAWMSPLTRYLSFLIRPEPIPVETPLIGYRPYFGIELASGPSQPEMFVGKNYQGDRNRYSLWRNGQSLSDQEIKLGQTSLLVLKMKFRGRECHVTLFTNPTPGEPEPSSNTYANFLFSSTSHIILLSNQPCRFDELRVGTSFESVTPSLKSLSNRRTAANVETPP